MSRTDLDAVRRAISGADFPVNRDDLVRLARDVGSDEATVRALSVIDAGVYASFAGVIQAVPLDADEVERLARQQMWRNEEEDVD